MPWHASKRLDRLYPVDDVLPITQPPVRQLLLQGSSEISSSPSAADLLVVETMMNGIAALAVMKAEMIASEKTDILAAVADHYYLVETENYSAVTIDTPVAVHYYFEASEEQPVSD